MTKYLMRYTICDPGKKGENIRCWHSSSTGQDTTVVSENDEYIETCPKPGGNYNQRRNFLLLCVD